MKKVFNAFLIACFIIISSLSLTACKDDNKSQSVEYGLENYRYFSLNISNFEELVLEPEENISQTLALNSKNSVDDDGNKSKMKFRIRRKGEKNFEDVEFCVEDDKNGNLKDHNGKFVHKGDKYNQLDLPIFIDKLCVMYDYTLLSFVSDINDYNRPPNTPAYYTVDPRRVDQMTEYDSKDYHSDETRASFIIDNRNGRLYYIVPGVNINVTNWGFIKDGLLQFTQDFKVKLTNATHKVDSYERVLRDVYGQNFVPSDVNYIDYENKVYYYKSNDKLEFVRTRNGQVLCVLWNTVDNDYYQTEWTIESVHLMGNNFEPINITEKYDSTADVDYYHKMHVGGRFVNKIENNTFYTSSGYSKIWMHKYGIVDNSQDKHVYLDVDYYNTSLTDYIYAQIWDHDTILVETTLVNGVKGLYYANVFEENEYDGTDETINKLHLIVEGDYETENCTNFGLAYLAEFLRNENVVVKDGVTYKIVEQNNALVLKKI